MLDVTSRDQDYLVNKIMPLNLAGEAIFDTMRHIRRDVSTVCVGLAAR
jgi:hypothetical protein